MIGGNMSPKSTFWGCLLPYTSTCQQPLKTPQKVSFQVVLLPNESILFLVPKIKKITAYRCNFGSRIKMRQIWRFQTLCWMLSEKSLFNFDALNYFLHRPEDWLLCYCFYMSTYWLMIGQDFALSAKNHESALSLLLLFLLLLSRMLQAESTLPSL